MTISELLLPEFNEEMEKTRKILERVPDGKLGWKPHEKSMTMGRLASHVAELPGWAADTINRESYNAQSDASGKYASFNAGSNRELLEQFEKKAAEGRAAISGVSDTQLDHLWTLSFDGNPVFSLPRRVVLRSVVMNHLIHHRGQLSVYLRLNGIPVPGSYGPSADEQ